MRDAVRMQVRRVLLVDSDPGTALKAQLELRAYAVETVDPEHALQAAAAGDAAYDAILACIESGPGLEPAEAACRILEHARIPVLFLSPRIDAAILEKTGRPGSYGCLLRDSSAEVIDAAIQNALRLFQETSRFRDSEHRYRTLFESSTDSIMTVEPPFWNFASANPATVSMFRTKDESDFVSHSPWELSPPFQPDGRSSAEKAAEMIATALRQGSHFFEWTHRRADGELFPATVLLSRIEIGGKQLLQATVRDITEGRKAIDALRESEEKHRRLVQNLHAGVVVHAADTRILIANEQASNLLGLDSEHLAGKMAADPAWRFVREDGSVMEPHEYPVNHVLRTREPLRHLTVGICRPEAVAWVLVNAFPEFDAAGDLVQVVVTFVDVTRRTEAEEALRLSRDIVTNLQNGLYIYELEDLKNDRSLRMVYANPASEQLTGIPGQQLVGRTVDENFPGLRAQAIPQRYAEVVRTGAAMNFEDIVYGDGRIPVSAFAVKAFPLPKNHVGVSFENITERKRAEEALRESQERLTATIASLDHLLFVLDQDGRFVEFYQPSADHRLFAPPEVFLHRHFGDVLPPSVHYKVAAALEELRSSGIAQQIEYELPVQGEVRWFQSTISKRCRADGGYAGATVLVSDISERKQAEDRLRKTESNLRAAQALARIGSWEWKLDQGSLTWSEEMYRLLGYEPHSLEPSEEAFFARVHPEDRPRIERLASEFLAGSGQESRHEFRTVMPDGTFLHIYGMMQLARDSHGRPERITGTIQDISELKRAEMLLNEALQHAQQSDKLKSIFLASMSHEIRTPLNAVVGYADLSLQEQDLSTIQDYLRIIKASSFSLLNIINDLLDFSRMEAGGMDIHERPFAVSKLFADIDAQARIALIQYKRTLDLKVSVEPGISVWITGDIHRLSQVLNNLITNAIKFTETGSVEFGVRICSATELEFFVRDTGKGIGEEIRAGLFEPFRKGDPGGDNHRGAGLGLAISQRLVSMMGGRIQVESQPGAGSVFRFTLPYRPASPAFDLPPPGESGNIAGKSVLLVEDDEVSLVMTRLMLEKAGCRVFVARDGAQALAVFQAEPAIELIVMDVHMPVKNGLAAAREIRHLEAPRRARPVPIVGLSAAVTRSEIEDGFRAGFTEYLAKPVAQPELLAVLQKHLPAG